MKIGLNLLLFGDRADRRILDRFGWLAELGFDGVEVPVFDPARTDVPAIRAAARAAGLELTVSSALPPGAHFHGDDPAPRHAAVRHVRDLIAVTAGLGARVACGPHGKPVGDVASGLPREQQRAEAARALRDLAPEAAAAGVVLALEPLNRFETDLVNTAAQGLELCAGADPAGLGLLLDTFHLHIEEKDSAAAIRAVAAQGRLAHVHASENDRGVPGSGQVAWAAVAAALREVRYDGWVVLESFNQTNQAIRTAVSCWRPFFASEEEYCRRGLAFVRGLLGGR